MFGCHSSFGSAKQIDKQDFQGHSHASPALPPRKLFQGGEMEPQVQNPKQSTSSKSGSHS